MQGEREDREEACSGGWLPFHALGLEHFLPGQLVVCLCLLARWAILRNVNHGGISVRGGQVTSGPRKEGMALTVYFLLSGELGQRGSCESSRPR